MAAGLALMTASAGPGLPLPEMSDPAASAVVALLSGDLIFGSHLQAALAPGGIAIANAKDADLLPDSQVVFVDLNRDADDRLGAISRLRAANPQRTIVGFCHHGASDLRRRGMEAGASSVIANRFLGEAAIRLTQANELAELLPGDD